MRSEMQSTGLPYRSPPPGVPIQTGYPPPSWSLSRPAPSSATTPLARLLTPVKTETLKAALAEGVGALLLTAAALLAGTPCAVALTLGAFVYAIGPISGANLNPAVTIGLITARRLPVSTGLLYILAQILGALLARLLAPLVGPLGAYHAGSAVGECLGFAFLMLTVIAVSDKYVPKSGSGIAIGAALAAGLVVSGGILNPAVAIAMGQARSAALWAPVLSSLVCVGVFRVYERKDQKEPEGGKGQSS